MRQYYGRDTARWEAHMRKLHDPMHEANRASGGRRARLSTLLQLNGLRGKDGVGCDAPGLWAQGKLEQLERYCARDVEALAELVLLTHVRVPGGGVATRVGVHKWLTGEAERAAASAQKRRAEDGGEGERRTAMRTAARDGQQDEPRAGGGERVREEGRGTLDGAKRQKTAPAAGYDETKRRKRRAAAGVGYADRSRHKQPRGTLKRGIEVGARVIDRIVAGRYEWRDAELRPMKGARRSLWDGHRRWDPGGSDADG